MNSAYAGSSIFVAATREAPRRKGNRNKRSAEEGNPGKASCQGHEEERERERKRERRGDGRGEGGSAISPKK